MNSFNDLENVYQVLDFSISHNRMLMRSMKNQFREYHIDLFFKGVSFICMTMRFDGIKISPSTPTEMTNLRCNVKVDSDEVGYSSFTLTDKIGDFYYITASAWGVFHNRLDLLETSLTNDNWEDLGELVLWYQ